MWQQSVCVHATRTLHTDEFPHILSMEMKRFQQTVQSGSSCLGIAATTGNPMVFSKGAKTMKKYNKFDSTKFKECNHATANKLMGVLCQSIEVWFHSERSTYAICSTKRSVSYGIYCSNK